jgi:hypothetical protein
MVKDSSFEGVWMMQTMQNLISKSGYTALRNHNLIRIDNLLKEMN